jgi:hypothetical protein
MNAHSLSERRRVALAEAIASSWGERGISYAVVHGLERYPVSIGRDLDVAIARESVAQAVETAVACARESGFETVLFRWSHWGLYQLALIDREQSIALPLDLLCTTTVWRAKWVQLVDRLQLDRITAGDNQVGPFKISEEGRFLKSCVRPLLCGDLSRVGGADREWSLPVPPPHSIEREQLEALVGPAAASALATASSSDELVASLPGGVRALQREWARSHALAAVRSIREATAGRLRRRLLNPAVCMFATSPEPEVVLEAAQELAREARGMFLDVRPIEMPRSRLRRIAADIGAWRAAPVSEFVVTVVVGKRSNHSTWRLLHRVFPTTAFTLRGGLSREQSRAILRTRILEFLAETYPPPPRASDRGQAQADVAPAVRRVGQTRV